jgi:hypothetical protein
MHQTVRRLALLAVLFGGGCAGSGRTPASDAEQAASANYTDCLQRAARKLDDHASEAPAIGAAVSSACKWEAQTLENTFYQGLDPSDRQALLEKLPTVDSEVGAATGAVARERADPQPANPASGRGGAANDD